MNFHSLYDQGFARVAAVTLPVHPARPFDNAREIIDAAKELDARGVAVAVYPELSVSGYAIDDLFLQDVLLDNVEKALAQIVEASADLLPLLIVGAPLRKDNALYNCAVAIHRGRVLAIVPKSHLPNYREFYEKRHFVTMPPRACERIEVPWGGIEEFSGGPVWVPFGQVLLSAADVPGLTIGIEICEDMWVPATPAAELALAGATVLANLSASPITVGRGADRELMVRSVSARCSAAYIYTAAGMGESSTDLAWDGETMIYEAGDRLAIGERFQEGAHITIADVDLERLRTERKRQNSFTDNAQRYFAGDPRSNRERMLARDWYVANDPDNARIAARARRELGRYERAFAEGEPDAQAHLRAAIPHLGAGAILLPPVRVDYGENIIVGEGSFANYGLTALDVATITIGVHCQFGPNVQLLTPIHPLEPTPRRAGLESADPIVIGDNVWLGGGVIVCPGVTIGDDCVIGAGAVVTRDIPARSLAVGSPARVIRTLDDSTFSPRRRS